MSFVEWVDEDHEAANDPEYDGPNFYVVDTNGIVAGPFDDEGEAIWWESKAKRV